MKTVVWLRPSGTTIELEDTKNFKKLAKDNGWKKKVTTPTPTPTPQLDMGDDNG